MTTTTTSNEPDQLLALTELRDKILRLPQTGSKAYGLPHWDDDDRMATHEEAKSIKEEMQKIGLAPLCQGRSIKIRLGGDLFNILSLSDTEMTVWKATTRAMKGILSETDATVDVLADKTNRVELFMHIRTSLLAMIRRNVPQKKSDQTAEGYE